VQADDNGSTFLYVEQQQGAMLSVYDFTNPGRIKLEASAPTGAHKSFDCVSAIGDSELIAFRDGSGSGAIDLHQAKGPKLAMIAGAAPTATEQLGDARYLASDGCTDCRSCGAAPLPSPVAGITAALMTSKAINNRLNIFSKNISCSLSRLITHGE